MVDVQKGIIALVRSALKAEPAALPEGFDWDEALQIAGNHHIAPMIFYGVFNSGIKIPEDIHAALRKWAYSAAVVDENQKHESHMLFEAFSQNNVEFMPLKGSVLKRLYPKTDMRVMSDVDVLVKAEQYDKICAIMKNLGYSGVAESDYEFKWSKPPQMAVEIHKRLVSPKNADLYKYFADGWALAKSAGKNGCHYEMSAEHHFIYLFAHFSKHYRNGGVGIKHFIDFWVFINKNPELNLDYIKTQLEKLGLGAFFKNILRVINVWFEGAAADELAEFITARLFAAGAYGTHENRVVALAARAQKSARRSAKTRGKRVLGALFLPYALMCERYPVLKKAPVLLPIFWALRILEAVIFNRKSIRKQYEDICVLTDEKIEKYNSDLAYVGLDFNFKE